MGLVVNSQEKHIDAKRVMTVQETIIKQRATKGKESRKLKRATGDKKPTSLKRVT